MDAAPTRRTRRALVATLCVLALGTIIVVGVAGPAAGRSRDPNDDPIPLKNLKIGLGCYESGGRYDIANTSSGAYGKYQIMPANWPSWARKYLGSSRAPQTPENQEIVASGKLLDLYEWLDYWRRVAYWWLTGDDTRDASKWSDHATRYVDGVLAIAERSMTAKGRRTIPHGCFSTPGDSTDPTGGQTTRYRRVVATGLWIRTGPGLDNDRVGILRQGDVVKVLDRERDGQGNVWIRVPAGDGDQHWVARWWTLRVDGPAKG